MTLLIDDDADLVPIKKRRLDRIDQNKDSKQIEGFKEQVAYFEMNRRRSKRSDVVSFYVNKVVRTAARLQCSTFMGLLHEFIKTNIRCHIDLFCAIL